MHYQSGATQINYNSVAFQAYPRSWRHWLNREAAKMSVVGFTASPTTSTGLHHPQLLARRLLRNGRLLQTTYRTYMNMTTIDFRSVCMVQSVMETRRIGWLHVSLFLWFLIFINVWQPVNGNSWSGDASILLCPLSSYLSAQQTFPMHQDLPNASRSRSPRILLLVPLMSVDSTLWARRFTFIVVMCQY